MPIRSAGAISDGYDVDDGNKRVTAARVPYLWSSLRDLVLRN
jgi:hypothetical protein